jgi:hypothetical protein
MARPTTWQDLPDHDRRGDEVARWNTYNAMGYPSIAKHLVAAAEAAVRAGLVVTNDGIYEKLSPEQLEEKLQRAQRHWDSMQEKYKVAVDFPHKKSDDMWSINNWAKQNGFPAIELDS